jgi:hypothetical protein
LLLFVITDYPPRVSTAELRDDVRVNSFSRIALVLRISGITAPCELSVDNIGRVESLVVCLIDNPRRGARILQTNEYGSLVQLRQTRTGPVCYNGTGEILRELVLGSAGTYDGSGTKRGRARKTTNNA